MISDPTALSEEELMLRETIRAFVRDEVEPGELERDRTHEFPHDLVAKLAEMGMLGIPVPEEYGGAGMSTLCYVIVVEEIAKVSGSLALTMAAHTSLGTMPIVDFGTEEQKQKFVPPLAAGEYLGAFALTEPTAGSDAGGDQDDVARAGRRRVGAQRLRRTGSRHAGTVPATSASSSGCTDKDKRQARHLGLRRGEGTRRAFRVPARKRTRSGLHGPRTRGRGGDGRLPRSPSRTS